MAPPPTLRARFRRSIGYRGLRRTLRVGAALALYRLRRGPRAPRPHAFDLEFGVDTVSLTGGGEVVGDGALGNPHEPIDTVDFAGLIALLPPPLEPFAFFDFGSGQGRALMLAAQFPFARIVGLEHDRALHESAERNLARYRRRAKRLIRCTDVRSVWADAALWPIPPVPAVFYFCEPFQAPLMRLVIGRVLDSLHAAPRPAYVLYVGDWHRALWEASGEFETLGGHYFDRCYRWRGAPPRS